MVEKMRKAWGRKYEEIDILPNDRQENYYKHVLTGQRKEYQHQGPETEVGGNRLIFVQQIKHKTIKLKTEKAGSTRGIVVDFF